MPDGTKARFARWFWRPPRAHGDTIPDRTVSALELFYDLVCVAVISQAAHHLADHVLARAFLDFAAVLSGGAGALAPGLAPRDDPRGSLDRGGQPVSGRRFVGRGGRRSGLAGMLPRRPG